MASGFCDKVLGLAEVGVNELVKNIFRSKVSALGQVPIDPIPWQRITELAAKYVVQNPHYVLSAKTEMLAPSASVPIGSLQTEFCIGLHGGVGIIFRCEATHYADDQITVSG